MSNTNSRSYLDEDQVKVKSELPPMSGGKYERVRLPRLHRPLRSKTSSGKPPSRQDSKNSRYDSLIDQITELQTATKKKFGKSINANSLHKMKKSIESMNRQLSPSVVSSTRQLEIPKESGTVSTSSSDTELKPSTKKVFADSKRISFKRRSEMTDKALVVLAFEGVVGDVFKENIWQFSPTKLYLRREAVNELKKLAKSFQLVLFIQGDKVKPGKLLDFFESRHVHFDAVYKALKNSNNETLSARKKFHKVEFKHLQSYTQVALDFKCQEDMLEKALVVSSLNLDIQENNHLSGVDLLFSNTSAKRTEFYCKGVPTQDSLNTNPLPVTLLIPNPQADPKFSGVPFSIISNTVFYLASFSKKEERHCSWLDGFLQCKLMKNKQVEAVETSIFHYHQAHSSVQPTKKEVEAESLLQRRHSCLTCYSDSSSLESQVVVAACKCPLDLKSKCNLNVSKICTTQKLFKAYTVLGKDIPTSFLKNKFLILKFQQSTSYREVHDHSPYVKQIFNKIKFM